MGTGGVIQHFDAAGKLIYITDASREWAGTGNYKNKTKVNYDFDGAGNIQVVDASGRSCTITLSGGKISSLSEDASWANMDGREPRTVSYEYNGPDGRLSKVTLNPGDHWSSVTYSATEPNLITQTESKVDGETTRKSYFEYTAGKLTAYRNPRSTSSSDDTYKSTITYNSGSTLVSSPQVSNDLGMPSAQFSSKYVYNAKGETTDVYSGVNPDGSGGLGRVTYAWNKCHQVTKVTDYQDLTTPLGSVSYVYDGKGNASKVEGQLPDGQTAVSTADYTASRSCSGNPTAATSPDGDKASLSYNSGENYMKGTDKVGAESVVLRDPSTENGRLSVTLPALLPNLLQNASMEKDEGGNGVADGWTTWKDVTPAEAATYQIYQVSENDSTAAGKKAQRLNIQGNTNTGNMCFYQQVTAEPDADYTLSFSYRNSPNPNQHSRVYIKQLDSSNTIVAQDWHILKPSTTWTRDSVVFRTKGNTAKFQIVLYVKPTLTNQELWADFDAVQLVKGSRSTAFNNMENPGFERSNGGVPLDPASWTISKDNGTHDSDARTTARYVSPGASLVLRGCESASQAVNVKKNTRYLVSGYVYVEQDTGYGGAYVKCGDQFLWADTSVGYYGETVFVVCRTGKWERVFRIVDSGDTDTLNIMCYGLGEAYFDDISLTELPDDSETTYDALGNYVAQVKSPRDAGSYLTGYVKTDPVGNMLEARDARSAGPTDGTYLFSYTYNELSQLTSVVSPLVHDALGQEIQSYSSSYDYDTAGRLLWLLDNNTEETGFEYNQLNQVTAKTDPNQRTVQMEYNEAGGVKKVTYPNGWEVYYAYRQNCALDKVAFKDPQNNLTNPYTFTYDGAGRLTQVSDAATGVTLNFTFDVASRLTAASSSYAGGFSSSYAYTKGGRLTSLTYSKSGWGTNVASAYAYRATGEHSTLTLPNADTVNYAYEDRGRLSSVRYVTDPASTTYYNSSSFTYDAAGRLASVTHNFHDSGMKVSYEYDAIGNVTRAVQDGTENLYAYDELGRLTSWTEKTDGQVVREEKYYYDGNGNITQVEKIGSTENHAYDAANQCTDNGFTYDECGNLTSDGEWDYEYERGSRLVSATNDAQNLKVAFSYDPQGRRYSKTAYERDGQGQYTVEKYARFYHYDSGGNILCETDAAGNIIRSYAYDLSGHPIAFTQDLGQGQRTFYVHTNARGDVVCITDDAMDWVKKLTYDPWGNILSETNRSSEYEALTCPYAYAGYFLDAETGLYYMPARYYSPEQRRFLTKDPHPGSKSQPITLNPYQYCRNNPVNKVDPSGQYDLDAIMSGLSGLSGLSSALEASLSQIAAGAALIRGGGLQAASFASSMSSFRSSVASSMSNMGGMVARISSGISQAVAGVSGLARFNWGGLASVGIRGGRTPEQAASDHETILEEMRRNPNPWPQSNDPRNIVQKVVDAVFFNPITRIGVGVAGIVVSALSIPVTFGLSLKGIWYSARIIDFAVQDIQDGNWAGNPYHHMP